MTNKKTIFFIIILSFYFQNIIAQDENPFPVSTPEEEYIDNEMLTILDSKIINNQYGQIHSLIIVRNGSLVFEKYYTNYYRDYLHSIASATKTITSALIGIAINQGKINGVDETMLNFFPEYANILYNDSLKQSITLKHLLTMTAGFDDESGLYNSADMLRFMLDMPIVHPPGTFWSYSNGSSILLAGIIQNRTGKSAEDFANTYLFTPLGISTWSWSKGPNDIPLTSGGLYLRPLDMALFGQLYLKQGEWSGNQIVPKEWIDESIKVYVKKAKTNRSYGYHLWQFQDSSAIADMLKKNDLFFASGARDQKIYIIPHLNCVIVFTCNNGDTEAILQNDILPAIKNSSTNMINKPLKNRMNLKGDLIQNYPNPFNPVTTIKYVLQKSDFVTLNIYNLAGQKIETLVHGFQVVGEHQVTWQPKGLPSGIYYHKLQAGKFSETKKLILQK